MADKISSKGQSRDEKDRTVAWAKDNGAALASCQRHHFQRMDDGVFSQYRCISCKGVVSGEVARAYGLGVEHGRKEKAV